MAFLLKDPLPKLQNSPIKLEALRLAAKNELVNILQEVRGEKTLIMTPQISGIMTLIAGISFLKEKGVSRVFTLDQQLSDTQAKAVIYIVQPKIELMKVKRKKKKNKKKKKFHSLFHSLLFENIYFLI